jgi:hypothetical protein
MTMRFVFAALLGVSLPLPVAHAQPVTEPELADDPVAADPVADDPVADSAAIAPGPPPPVAAAPLTAAPPEPEYTGKGLLISAYVLTGFSWMSRIIGLGTGLSVPDQCGSEGCNTTVINTSVAFTYMAPIAQFAATAVIIPGGILKGRSDGHAFVTTGGPERNARALTIAGGVIFGVFTATSIALRPAVLLGCVSDLTGCGGRGTYIGYMLGVQLSDTLSTAGAGLLSYGIGYGKYRKRYGTQMSFAPFSSQGAHGLSFAGRF